MNIVGGNKVVYANYHTAVQHSHQPAAETYIPGRYTTYPSVHIQYSASKGLVEYPGLHSVD